MLNRWVGAVRRNHALEHATVTLLLSRIPFTRMIARASQDGFYLWGKVSPEQLETNVHEALARLKSGEGHLAVSPLCGTNLAIGGFMTGAASMMALGSERGMSQLPKVATWAMLGLIASQPIGRLAQRHFTTSPDASGMEVVGVRQIRPHMYKVQTTWNPVPSPAEGPVLSPAEGPAA